ncbi:MAG: prefoldin subunit alpha [Thermoplasmata archaeon]|nr:MAG: prefoldin subunit alpha [Thermoplasmata archaeon]HDD57483.1 prefoldin subunit alpha [Thermoplasmatales archaeon]
MTEQIDASEYISLFEAYKEQLESLEKQAAYVQAIIEDYTKAKVTMEKLSKTKKDSDVLVPIGGGVFLYAKYDSNAKVLLSEGADVVIERDIDYAIDALQKRIDDLNNGLTKLNEMAIQLQQKMQDISLTIQQLFSKKEK